LFATKITSPTPPYERGTPLSDEVILKPLKPEAIAERRLSGPPTRKGLAETNRAEGTGPTPPMLAGSLSASIAILNAEDRKRGLNREGTKDTKEGSQSHG
jgi:hypothetical protein